MENWHIATAVRHLINSTRSSGNVKYVVISPSPHVDATKATATGATNTLTGAGTMRLYRAAQRIITRTAHSAGARAHAHGRAAAAKAAAKPSARRHKSTRGQCRQKFPPQTRRHKRIRRKCEDARASGSVMHGRRMTCQQR